MPETKKKKVKAKRTPQSERDDRIVRASLQDELGATRAEIEREERQKEELKAEREKIHYFWVLEKEQFTKRDLELRERHKAIEDQKARQDAEIKLWKRRLKDARMADQDGVTKRVIAAESVLKESEDRNRERLQRMGVDQKMLKEQLREDSLSQDEFFRLLRLRQDKEVLGLRQRTEAETRDLLLKHQLNIKQMREKMTVQRKREVDKVEQKKNQHIESVQTQNATSLQAIKQYYLEITTSNVDLIKRLKEEHEDLKKIESRDTKEMQEQRSKIAALTEPLADAEKDVERLQTELVVYEADKKKLRVAKEKLNSLEAQIARAGLQEEIIEQKLEVSEKLRDDLRERVESVAQELYQKSGLKRLVLEKKLERLDEDSLVSQAQLNEVAHMAESEAAEKPYELSESTKKMLEDKDNVIYALENKVDSIARCCEEMTEAYEAVLRDYSFHKDDLGFVPDCKASRPPQASSSRRSSSKQASSLSSRTRS